MVRPNSIGDDLSWEPKSLKAGRVGRYLHPQTISMSDRKNKLAMASGFPNGHVSNDLGDDACKLKRS